MRMRVDFQEKDSSQKSEIHKFCTGHVCSTYSMCRVELNAELDIEIIISYRDNNINYDWLSLDTEEWRPGGLKTIKDESYFFSS